MAPPDQASDGPWPGYSRYSDRDIPVFVDVSSLIKPCFCWGINWAPSWQCIEELNICLYAKTPARSATVVGQQQLGGGHRGGNGWTSDGQQQQVGYAPGSTAMMLAGNISMGSISDQVSATPLVCPHQPPGTHTTTTTQHSRYYTYHTQLPNYPDYYSHYSPTSPKEDTLMKPEKIWISKQQVVKWKQKQKLFVKSKLLWYR